MHGQLFKVMGVWHLHFNHFAGMQVYQGDAQFTSKSCIAELIEDLLLNFIQQFRLAGEVNSIRISIYTDSGC